MNDIIAEINQDIKREKFEAFLLNNWKKFLFLAGLALALTAGNLLYKSNQQEKSTQVGEVYYNAYQNKKSEEFLKVIEQKHKGFSPLAGLSYAAVSVSKGKKELALKTLDEIINNIKYDPAFIELAKINKANLMISLKKPETEITMLLNSLDKDTSIFRLTVQELKANYFIEKGKFADATKILENLAFSENVPITIQERARKLLKTISN